MKVNNHIICWVLSILIISVFQNMAKTLKSKMNSNKSFFFGEKFKFSKENLYIANNINDNRLM